MIEEVLNCLPPEERRRLEEALKPKREAERLGLPQGDGHRVFVYGTLLLGECNEHWGDGARRFAATTKGRIFDTGFGFPAYQPVGAEGVGDGEVITGEMLIVDDEGLARLDQLEGYPRLYRRERIQIQVEDRGVETAWVYIMNRLPKGAQPIVGGDWRKHRAAWREERRRNA